MSLRDAMEGHRPKPRGTGRPSYVQSCAGGDFRHTPGQIGGPPSHRKNRSGPNLAPRSAGLSKKLSDGEEMQLNCKSRLPFLQAGKKKRMRFTPSLPPSSSASTRELPFHMGTYLLLHPWVLAFDLDTNDPTK